MAINISGSFVDDTTPMTGNMDGVPHFGIQGPSGPQGDPGGYYVPAIEQTGENELEVSFSPSLPDMPYVAPVKVTVTPDPDSGGNVDLTGVVKSVNGQTPDENGNVTIAVSAGGAVVADYDVAVKSINHRGYNTVAPENTIPAYILSAQKGFEFVECDVAFTSDGVPVLLHDSTIDRTSNGSGAISSMTYAEAAQYDYGSWKSAEYAGTHLPTLKEFLTVCKALKLRPYIEIKDGNGTTQNTVHSIAAIVKATGMRGKVSYISFNATYLDYVKAVDPFSRLGYVVDRVTSTVISTARGLKLATNEIFINANHSNLTDGIISLCIDADIPLEAWTVNDETWIENMNPYISGVSSDSLIAEKVLYDKYIDYTAPDIPVEPDAPEVTLTSISATYNGGDVTVGTVVTALTDVIVTAYYSDGSTETVTGYTLSGEISEGENTVTVSYGGMTTTFTVTGVSESGGDEPSGKDIAWENDNKVVIPSDYLKFGVGNVNDKTGIYYTDRPERTSYTDFDISADYLHEYTFNIETTENVQFGIHAYTAVGLQNYLNGYAISGSGGMYDPGRWFNNGESVTFPLIYNNSEIVGMRFTFHAMDASGNDKDMTSDMITKVTITRKKIADTEWMPGYVSANGTIGKMSGEKEMYTEFIPVVSGEVYRLHNDNAEWISKWAAAGFYSSDSFDSFVSRDSLGEQTTAKSSFTFTVPEGANYMVVASRNMEDYWHTAVIEKVTT